ncbi:enoyl-CoA hydratase/carnithine racemase [Nocardia transvalensis]|uniref:Enoyl-CoA hydratase/carnithine racemase n=1 Tax=Nocardia transvalensis TaxID=37333 RepID=A0A7W9PG17_9NOCA|nr:enoyl-CoA hydratase/isomerase family protein [Nocardia transvalensis]MBB5915432.1 enoyl-CoA hydratase/carnithine racemase [Nocardia transvalensis]
MIDTTGLDLGPDGRPGAPLVVLEPRARELSTAEAVRLAATVDRALPLVVVALREPPTPEMRPLLSAATLTLTEHAAPDRWQQVVRVPDLDSAVESLRRAVAHAPRAAVACGQLLRQTSRLPTTPALAAEAAVYSMLLGGAEFAAWLAERGPARPIPAPDRDPVLLRRLGDRLSITLDQPGRRNALGTRMREELLSALQLAAADPEIESIELSGSGPAFCSGGDLDEFGIATDLVAAYLVRLDRAPWALMDGLAGRLTARVHGPCIGAGAEIAAFAGTVIADPGTCFRFPETHMGLVPGAGGTVAVPRRIGRWRAAWLMLTRESLPAHRALEWGLVDEVVPDGREIAGAVSAWAGEPTGRSEGAG